MKRGRVLWHLVKADFLGRVRRTELSGHAGLRRLPRLPDLRRPRRIAARRLSWRLQLGVGRRAHGRGHELVSHPGRLLHREGRDPARRNNPCRSDSRRHPDEQKFLHAGQIPRKLRGARRHGASSWQWQRSACRCSAPKTARCTSGLCSLPCCSMPCPRWPSLPRSPCSSKRYPCSAAASATSCGSSSGPRCLAAGIGPAATRGGSLTTADYFRDFSGLPTMMVQMRTTLLQGRSRLPRKFLPQHRGKSAAASICLDWHSLGQRPGGRATHLVRLRYRRRAARFSLLSPLRSGARAIRAETTRDPGTTRGAGAGRGARTGAQRSMGGQTNASTTCQREEPILLRRGCRASPDAAGPSLVVVRRCRRPHRRLSRRTAVRIERRHHPRGVDLAHADLVADGQPRSALRHRLAHLLRAPRLAAPVAGRLGRRRFWSRWPPAVDSPSVS